MLIGRGCFQLISIFDEVFDAETQRQTDAQLARSAIFGEEAAAAAPGVANIWQLLSSARDDEDEERDGEDEV